MAKAQPSSGISPVDFRKFILLCAKVERESQGGYEWPQNAYVTLIEEYIPVIFRAVVPSQTFELSSALRNHELELTLLDLGIIVLMDVMGLHNNSLELTGKSIWPDSDLDRLGEESAFHHMLIHATNTLLGMRSLVRGGFDNEARVLLRHFVEVADLALAVCIDTDIYTAYLQSLTASHESAYAVWRKQLSPEQVRRRLDIWDQDGGSSEIGELRRNVYKDLSRFSHVNRLTITVGAILGERNFEFSAETAHMASLYTVLFVQPLRKLLINNHNIKPDHTELDFTMSTWFRQEVFVQAMLQQIGHV